MASIIIRAGICSASNTANAHNKLHPFIKTTQIKCQRKVIVNVTPVGRGITYMENSDGTTSNDDN